VERAGELERPALSRDVPAMARGGRAALLLGLACSGGVRSPAVPHAPAPARRDECALASDSGAGPDTLTLALSGTVDPSRAPVPESDAERMAFRQLYETLVRLDCAGTPQPQLAADWSSDAGWKRWTFKLRAGARFWDGQPVTASAVIASWQAGDTSLLGGATLAALDDQTLVIQFAGETPNVPQLVADPSLAVTRTLPGRDWPTGSGGYTADTTGGRMVLAPVDGVARPVIVLRPVGVSDARDWIDRGVDLLVTDDRAALSYAAGRSDLASRPLPWDRSYVLLAPGAPPEVTSQWRESLARDAVHVAARPAAPGWWDAFPACAGPPPSGATAPAASRAVVVYPREDPTARDLAGRLVALEGEAGGPLVRVAGLAPAELAAALASGQPAQFVIALPRVVPEPCGAIRRLMGRAPWLSLGTQIVPLVETRRQVVWRRGAAAFTVDWDATLRAR
jgi:extracellular solute-binding protein (family 5)